MKILFWNGGGGPTREKLDWLEAQPWDASILVEVSGEGRNRLRRSSAEADWDLVLNQAPRAGGGRRMTVAVLARDAVRLGELIDPPPAMSDPRYQERAGAVVATSNSIGGLLLAGAHMPHGAGPDKQGPKERAYEALSTWIRSQSRPLVLGIDTNTWTDRAGEASPDATIREALRHQTTFQRRGAAHDLHDAYARAAQFDPQLAEESAYWTYGTGKRRHRWDQIWVSHHFTCTGAHVSNDAPGVRKGGAHRPLTVDLESAAAGRAPDR